MKILIAETPKERLPVGVHSVKIVKIEKGTNQNRIEYFECFFENNQGVCSSRYYITEKAMYRIIALFRVCNLSAENNQTVETDDLIGKELKIENVSKLRDGNQFVDTVAVYPLPISTGVDAAPFQNPFEDDDDDGLPF
jgi:hypothetical protein